MKNLANCKPLEFLSQTAKIKHAVERWLKITNISSIRHRLPELKEIRADMEKEEKERILAENRERTRQQLSKNLLDMFDAAFEHHPEETLEILALCCFIEPAEADNYPISDYLDSLTEIINNKSVLNFFISLIQLGRMNIPVVSTA